MLRVAPVDEDSVALLPKGQSSTLHEPISGSSLQIWLDQQPTFSPRATLPPPLQAKPSSSSLVQLVKDALGNNMNLARMPTPVQFHEPITELQQRAEDLQFTELLDKAKSFPKGSLERLVHVAAFSMTAYSGLYRENKPFFSLMGETYELVCPEKGFRLFSEKVQHEPVAIGHSLCEGQGWTWELEDELRMRFAGTGMELLPAVLLKVTFGDGDTFEYHKGVTTINGILFGKIDVDHKGSWPMVNCGTGMVAHVTFLPKSSVMSRVKRGPRHVEAYFEANGAKIANAALVGRCDESLYLDRGNGHRECIWKAPPPPKDPTRFSFMSDWPLRLNHLPEGLESIICPTDARFRRDVRLLEEGAGDEAQAEKVRLEKKQDLLHINGQRPQPRWFEPVPGASASNIGKKFLFRYKGGYWEARDSALFQLISSPWA